MAYNEQLANRVRELIVRNKNRVEEKKMFGGICFMVNDKMCIGVESERIMVRFDPALKETVMKNKGAMPKDFTWRVMNGYAFVEAGAVNTEKVLPTGWTWHSTITNGQKFQKNG